MTQVASEGVDHPAPRAVGFKLKERQTASTSSEATIRVASIEMLQPDLDGTFPGGRVSALSVTLSQDESMSEQEQGSDASEDVAQTCNLPNYVQIAPTALVVQDQVGSGAFCTVDRAEYTDHTGELSTVAVKRMKPKVAALQEEVNAFVKEALVMSTIKHRSIVKFRGMGSNTNKVDGGLFVVQEYLPGGSLKQILTRQTRSWLPVFTRRVGVSWMLSIAEALEYLHAQRPNMIIHRDLKSDNIFLTHSSKRMQPQAKLGDFGLHRLVKVREGKQSLPNTFNTDDLDQILAHPLEAMSTDNLRKKRRGSWIMAFQRPPSVMGAPAARIKYDLTRMCGSLLYMAPEVYHGASYCEKCDVFSLGIVMFEIATRTPMVDAINLFGRKMTVKAFVKEVASGARLPIPGYVPKSIAGLIQRCWEQDPNVRISASQAVVELKQISQSSPMCSTSCFGHGATHTHSDEP